METKANHFLMGLFVLIMSVAGVMFIYWTQKLSNKGTNFYTIEFSGQVGGLTKASRILFNGIPVGHVSQLKIDPDDGRKTHVTITIEKGIPVRKNSSARIETNMLTGTANIHLSAGTPDSRVLSAKDDGLYPAIAATRVSGKSLLEGAPDLINNSNAMILRLNEMLANNEALVRKSMKNVQAFTQSLEDNKENFSKIMNNAAQLTENLNTTTKTINQIVIDTRKPLISTMQNIDEITTVLKDQKQDIAAIISNSKDLTQKASNAVSQLELLITENRVSLAKTMNNIEGFTGMLNDNKGNVAVIIQDAQVLTERFKSVAAKIEKTVDEFANFKLDEQGNSIIAEAKSAVTSFKNLANKLDKSFGNKAIKLADGADKSIQEFQSTMSEARTVIRNLNDVVEKIGNHPLLGGSEVPTYNSAN